MTTNTQPTSKPDSRRTPRICVISVSDYDVGRLHGRWIDATQPIEDIHREVGAMLAESREPGATEYAIYDYEGFGCLSLSDGEKLEHVAEVARLTQQYGPVFPALVKHRGGALYVKAAADHMACRYFGVFPSLAEYARACVDEHLSTHQCTHFGYILCNTNFKRMGRAMELEGTILALRVEGKLHIFDGQH